MPAPVDFMLVTAKFTVLTNFLSFGVYSVWKCKNGCAGDARCRKAVSGVYMPWVEGWLNAYCHLQEVNTGIVALNPAKKHWQRKIMTV